MTNGRHSARPSVRRALPNSSDRSGLWTPQEDVDAAASVVQRRSPVRPSAAPLSHCGSSVSQKGGRTGRKTAEEPTDGLVVRLKMPGAEASCRTGACNTQLRMRLHAAAAQCWDAVSPLRQEMPPRVSGNIRGF